MNCLLNMCYVCLEKKDKSVIDINKSLSVNEDIIHIIGYLPCNLGWMKTKQIILICEECCRRLRETYQFVELCLKNSAVLQGYMAKINTALISDTNNEAEPSVDRQDDINTIKCEIKSEDEEIYTVEKGPIIEETEYEFVNVQDSLVKEENNWKKEVVGDEEEPPMKNNSIERSDNESDSVIFVNSNTHDTDTDSDNSGFASTQVHTTNEIEPNTAAKKSYKCLTCSKSFSRKATLQIHTRVHTGEKPYKCVICEKCFKYNSNLVNHMVSHTGEKPYKCSICKRCFNRQGNLVTHMHTHSAEKLYKCFRCNKYFGQQSSLGRHMRAHTGEKPYECSACKKCFGRSADLIRHMRIHTGEKPDV